MTSWIRVEVTGAGSDQRTDPVKDVPINKDERERFEPLKGLNSQRFYPPNVLLAGGCGRQVTLRFLVEIL